MTRDKGGATVKIVFDSREKLRLLGLQKGKDAEIKTLELKAVRYRNDVIPKGSKDGIPVRVYRMQFFLVGVSVDKQTKYIIAQFNTQSDPHADNEEYNSSAVGFNAKVENILEGATRLLDARRGTVIQKGNIMVNESVELGNLSDFISVRAGKITPISEAKEGSQRMNIVSVENSGINLSQEMYVITNPDSAKAGKLFMTYSWDQNAELRSDNIVQQLKSGKILGNNENIKSGEISTAIGILPVDIDPDFVKLRLIRKNNPTYEFATFPSVFSLYIQREATELLRSRGLPANTASTAEIEALNEDAIEILSGNPQMQATLAKAIAELTPEDKAKIAHFIAVVSNSLEDQLTVQQTQPGEPLLFRRDGKKHALFNLNLLLDQDPPVQGMTGGISDEALEGATILARATKYTVPLSIETEKNTAEVARTRASDLVLFKDLITFPVSKIEMPEIVLNGSGYDTTVRAIDLEVRNTTNSKADHAIRAKFAIVNSLQTLADVEIQYSSSTDAEIQAVIEGIKNFNFTQGSTSTLTQKQTDSINNAILYLGQLIANNNANKTLQHIDEVKRNTPKNDGWFTKSSYNLRDDNPLYRFMDGIISASEISKDEQGYLLEAIKGLSMDLFLTMDTVNKSKAAADTDGYSLVNLDKLEGEILTGAYVDKLSAADIKAQQILSDIINNC